MEYRHRVWLPIIQTPPLPKDRVAFNHLCVVPGQQHPSLIWDECLARAAQVRADNVSVEWDHKFRGKWVNEIVRSICYIASEYGNKANSIESLVAGIEDPVKALEALLRSSHHADHLLGRNDFFRVQNRVGIAFLNRTGSQYTFYYVFLISK